MLGPSRASVLAASLLFVVGGVLNVLAASINGFAMQETHARFGESLSPDLRAFAWALNQTLAAVAVVAHAGAMILFGLRPFVGAARRLEGAVRGLGLLAGCLALGILIVHRGSLVVHTAMMIYGLEALWIMSVGVFMLFAQDAGHDQDPAAR
jgi:hypothetical protein